MRQRTALAIGLAAAMSLTASAARQTVAPPRQPAPDAKARELRDGLERRLSAIAGRLDGVLGYSIVDLATGDRIERLQDDVFPTASTIKLALLYELYRQADGGKVRLDDSRPVPKTAAVGGTGILKELTSPVLSLRDYATLMVVLSDNTATNLLIDVVGMANVNARMESLGLKATKLRRKMIDLEAARRGDENVSTPRELTALLRILDRGDGLAPPSRTELLDILKKEKSTPMRRGIPSDVPVANKPGSLEGVAVDAGIVYLKERPYLFAAMATWLRDDAAGDAAIADASRATYEYFERLAASSEYGRRIR